MTHDLLRNLIIELGIQVERVVRNQLRDNTFFARIEMRMSDGNRMALIQDPRMQLPWRLGQTVRSTLMRK